MVWTGTRQSKPRPGQDQDNDNEKENDTETGTDQTRSDHDKYQAKTTKCRNHGRYREERNMDTR